MEKEARTGAQQAQAADGLASRADQSRKPSALSDISPTKGGTPILKSVPLALIRAARNPRHADHRHTARAAGGAVGGLSMGQPVSPGTNAGGGTSTGTDLDADLEGLARSLGAEEAPRLAEPPVVEEMPDGGYRLCAGERRVEAARLAGWANILCLVYPRMDPARAHTLSLVENIHRMPMHPLEEISALCISWLLANADARGIGVEARRILEDAWDRGASSYTTMQELEGLLKEAGWTPERPDVSWKAHLDDLGISMAPWERKRKLRMLNIAPTLQEQLRTLDITEAALRSLGTLGPDDQARVVEALVANPSLARKVRRVARARRDGFYASIEDALAEVQGLSHAALSPGAATGVAGLTGVTAAFPGDEQTLLPARPPKEEGHPPGLATSATSITHADHPGVQASQSFQAPWAPEGPQVTPELQDAVLQLLECADRLAGAMNSLQAHGGGVSLPEPWGGWSRDALGFINGLLPDPGAVGAIPASGPNN